MPCVDQTLPFRGHPRRIRNSGVWHCGHQPLSWRPFGRTWYNGRCEYRYSSRTPWYSCNVWWGVPFRCSIYLNTTRGLTPAGSPLDSPDPLTNLSVATGDSFSAKRQVRLPQHHTCSPHHISRSDHEQTPTPPLDQGQYQLLLTPESASTSDAFPYEKEALSDSQ